MTSAMFVVFMCFLGAGTAAALCVPNPTVVKSRAVVVGMRITGATPEDDREVELDVMVSRPEGGQFPAHETAVIPASWLAKVSPGSVIDTYYRPGDPSALALCVSPSSPSALHRRRS